MLLVRGGVLRQLVSFGGQARGALAGRLANGGAALRALLGAAF